MKNPFSFFTRENLQASYHILARRFPLPASIIFLLTGILLYFIQGESKSDELMKICFTLGVTFFFSTGVALYIENDKRKKYTQLLHLLPILYGIWVYLRVQIGMDWFLESFVFLSLHLFGFVAFLFFAPYLDRFFRKDEEEIEYSNYFSLVSWTLLMSSITGLSLLVLGFIAIGSVYALFDISTLLDESKCYANWAVIALAFVAPLYGLIQFPIRSDISTKAFETNKFFSFLILYIGVPFIFIYFLILYIYSGQVLLHFGDWPKGIISWMVIGFSIFGYLCYIFSKPYESENHMIAFFRKYFPYVVLPQIFMLFYAIYLRISQYDITMNRYFVIIFGLWLTFTSLYLVISKKKALSTITTSLALLSFVISIGPWSVFSYPLNRQYDRLVANLEKANILKNGVITPLTSPKDISKDLSNDIYSGIQYVCDFSECQAIKDLFQRYIQEESIKSESEWRKWNTETGALYPGLSKWEIINLVTEKIKVQVSYSYESTTNQKYIQYSTIYQYEPPYPLTIDNGYTKVVKISGANNEYDSLTAHENEKDSSYSIYPYISINPEDSTIGYHKGSGVILKIPFNPPLSLMSTTTPTGLEQKDLTFTVTSDQIEAKLYLQNFAVKNPEYSGTGGYDSYSINGIGLVKEKK